VLWSKLAEQKDIGELHAIRLYEDEDLYADVRSALGLDSASVTRRYSFVSGHNGDQGREWDCFITIQGTIDPVTGMVTDLASLDRFVKDTVLPQVAANQIVTGEDLAQRIWHALVSRITSGRLARVHLVHSRDLSFDYSG
jgi:6-pyruvoyltetrahydropterin/6-carboxytetrahydropterin synthase